MSNNPGIAGLHNASVDRASYSSPSWGMQDLPGTFQSPQGEIAGQNGSPKRDVPTVLHEHANALMELDEAIVQCVSQSANYNSRLDHCDAMIDRLQQSVEACFELAAASKRDWSTMQQTMAQNPTPPTVQIGGEEVTDDKKPSHAEDARPEQGAVVSRSQDRDVVVEIAPAASVEAINEKTLVLEAITEVRAMQTSLKGKLDSFDSALNAAPAPPRAPPDEPLQDSRELTFWTRVGLMLLGCVYVALCFWFLYYVAGAYWSPTLEACWRACRFAEALLLPVLSHALHSIAPFALDPPNASARRSSLLDLFRWCQLLVLFCSVLLAVSSNQLAHALPDLLPSEVYDPVTDPDQPALAAYNQRIEESLDPLGVFENLLLSVALIIALLVVFLSFAGVGVRPGAVKCTCSHGVSFFLALALSGLALRFAAGVMLAWSLRPFQRTVVMGASYATLALALYLLSVSSIADSAGPAASPSLYDPPRRRD